MVTIVLRFNIQNVQLRFILFTFFIFFLSLSGLTGQENYVPPKIPDKTLKALNDAVLSAAAGNTDSSVKAINELIEKYPTWTLPRQKLSEIYYNAGQKENAISTLESTIAIDTSSQIHQLYSLGRLYEATDSLDDAMKVYRCILRLGTLHPDLIKKTTINIDQLEQKMKLRHDEIKITFTPFPPEINTPNEEYLGRWTLDGKEFIFTRRFNHQEDILIASYENPLAIEVKDFPFNTAANEAAQTISPDGKYLVFTSCERADGFGGCDLYISEQKQNTWSRPVNMGSSINTPSWESQPCFGLDGTTIYFSSSRVGGFGGRDIWWVKKLPNGTWSTPINAGKEINSANNEESPFIHFDGRTMYFMRDGKSGLGGFDLYISRMGLDGQWQAPENMGSPINTGTDEGAFSLHPDGRHAVITRVTPDQRNDLFEFLLPDKFLSSPVQALEVHVTEEKTNHPVRATIEVFEVTGQDTIRTSQLSDETGRITMTLERNKSYGMITSADGYLMHSLNLPPDTSVVRTLEVEMTPIAASTNKTIVLENIFFETASSALLPSSDPELNKLLQTLQNNPSMKIEIRGHTDNVGDESYNQKLSEARAQSVYQYLLDHSIDVSRLSYKGFGETQPVASNDSEVGRRQNRRTEFVILKI